MTDSSLNVFEIDIDFDTSDDESEYTFTQSPIRRRSTNNSYRLYTNEIIFDHLRKTRYFTYLMSLIFIGFYFIAAIVDKRSIDSMNPDREDLKLTFVSNWPDCSDQRYQIWRFITSGFVHGNFFHILFNVMMFYSVSNYLEMYQHHFVLLFLYIFSKLSSGFFVYYTDPYVTYIGCSDGVFALIGSLLSHLTFNLNTLSRIEISVLLTIPTISLFFDIIFFIFTKSNTAYFAHWNGLVNGFLLGLVIYKSILPLERNKGIRMLSLIVLVSINMIYINNYFHWPPEYGYKLQHKEPICCEIWLLENNDKPKDKICTI